MPEHSYPHREATPTTDPFVVGPTEIDPGSGTGQLVGTRFAVKDLFDVAGTRTGAGNPERLRDAPISTAHAASVTALLDQGAALWGKTVTDELALSLSGTNVHYGTPSNPAVPGSVPGGSSSGSVSAVAAGLVDFALGTDTGGSTRVPASYCGVLGLRSTHGRISHEGVMFLAPSFCAVGVFARSAALLAKVESSLANGAPGAERSPARRPSELVALSELFELADEGARGSLWAASEQLAAQLGLPLRRESLRDLESWAQLLNEFRAIQLAEAWEVHGPWLTARRPHLGPGIAARFAAASRVAPDEVAAARAARERFRVEFASLLGTGSFVLQPAASGAAPPILQESAEKEDLRRRTMMLTAPAGMAGAPVLSLPLAADGGAPVGLALVGGPGDDPVLVELALAAGR